MASLLRARSSRIQDLVPDGAMPASSFLGLRGFRRATNRSSKKTGAAWKSISPPSRVPTRTICGRRTTESHSAIGTLDGGEILFHAAPVFFDDRFVARLN